MTESPGLPDEAAPVTVRHTILSPPGGLAYDVESIVRGEHHGLQIETDRDGERRHWKIVPNPRYIVQEQDRPSVYRFDEAIAFEIDDDGHILQKYGAHLFINVEVRADRMPTGVLRVWRFVTEQEE